MQKIFEEFSSIPLGVLLEPYIKQCQISKNVALNVFDFEFFLVIAKHEKLSVKDAVLLLDL